MAAEKVEKSWAAFAHAFTYTLPFLFITQSLPAILFIMGTHFVIDRWRLARYLCWAKNFLQPKTIVIGKHITISGKSIAVNDSWKDLSEDTLSRNHKWEDCSATGYHKDRSVWMTVWLMIICDNVMHCICNAIAINYL